jgi:hypothetical protein
VLGKLYYILAGAILALFLALFAMDGSVANYPQQPDPASGRIFPVQIKLHGTVYLTSAEYAPRYWVYGLIIIFAVGVGVLYVVDKFRTGD